MVRVKVGLMLASIQVSPVVWECRCDGNINHTVNLIIFFSCSLSRSRSLSCSILSYSCSFLQSLNLYLFSFLLK